MATRRLCDATIAFTIGVLEGCKRYSDLKASHNKNHLDNVNKALKELYGKYGSGSTGLQSLASSVGSNLNEVKGSSVKSFVQQIGTAFNDNLKAISPDNAATLAQKVGEYLKGVLKTWVIDNASGVETQLQQLGSTLKSTTPYDPTNKLVSQKISSVNGAIKTDVSTSNLNYLTPILESGKQAFIWQLQKGNYTPTNYVKTVSQYAINTTHAKIFLGCLPLIFNNLSYFYWQCRDGGAWENQNLTGGSLSPFMESHWFRNSYMNENMTGTSVVRNVFDKKLTELKTAALSQKSYSDFLREFKSTGEKTWKSASTAATDSTFLSGLYILCSCYFQCQQIKVSYKASRGPQTIREMLYFLAALQFSPQYDNFDKYVTEDFKTLTGNQSSNDVDLKLQVADSGTSATGNTLSASDFKSYLRSSFLLPPSLLGWLHGPGYSNEPWLHELYCNTDFQFKYPSGSGLFNALSNCAYALQFQLLFLYQQCSNNGVKCGWQDCTYGRDVNGSGNPSLKSHICPGFKCEDGKCDHNSGECKHNDYSQNEGCGKGSNPSPLQAFITGALPSFNLSTSTTPNHMSDHPQGALCHTPMGFKATHLRQDPGTGNYILSALRPICGDVFSPFRQLCEKLGCLTKRTPRTLGDLFGFMWHLNGQLFNRSEVQSSLQAALQQSTTQTLNAFLTSLKALQPSSLLSNSIAKLAEVSFWNTPDSYGLASLLAANLFSLNQHCHKKEKNGTVKHNGTACSNSPADLHSLYQSLKPKTTARDLYDACRKGNCGPYLSPLTHSAGATYAPANASVYLSWMVYLTDDLQTGFQELIDEFKNIDCLKTGCRTSSSNTKCDKAHFPGTHGASPGSCTCDSVVQCGGTLPLLYRHGFWYFNPAVLMGRSNNNTKRDCKAFAAQLQTVVNGDPLTNLLTTIDEFLYLFRFYFFYNQSAFWTIYICLILYTFFFLLDTLHLRSHLKLTSSHVVPPLALLTSGTPLPITNLTYIGQ